MEVERATCVAPATCVALPGGVVRVRVRVRVGVRVRVMVRVRVRVRVRPLVRKRATQIVHNLRYNLNPNLVVKFSACVVAGLDRAN